MCLGNISGDFSANNMKKNKTKQNKTGLSACMYFSIDCRAFDTSNIVDIRKYFIKKHNIKLCLEFLKKCFLCY